MINYYENVTPESTVNVLDSRQENVKPETESLSIQSKTIHTYQNLEYIEFAPVEILGNQSEQTSETVVKYENENGVVRNGSGMEDVTEENKEQKMYYEIEDIPSWYLTIFLGFQVEECFISNSHFLVQLDNHSILIMGSTLGCAILLLPAMCMRNDDEDRGKIISTYLFVAGITTILQSTFGTRLPIVQGASFAFLIPALTILRSEKWRCPSEEISSNLSEKDATELWQKRMLEIQGAIIINALIQMGLGFFGVFGFIMQCITPITRASVLILIGISVFQYSSELAATNWIIAAITIICIIVLSQYLNELKIPIPFTQTNKRKAMMRYPMFQIFPVLITIAIVWTFCEILILTGVISENNTGRTEEKLKIVQISSWFALPYPFQWGSPTISGSAVIGFMSAILAGIVESLGDYHATAKIVKAPTPPMHSINRGILMEGLGCFIAGMFGTGSGTTSYSENAGAISITKVGSRRVVQTAGFILMIASLIGKCGSFFAAIPDPILGGVLCTTFAIIIGAGMSNLENVRLSSSRNMFVIGFSIFFPLMISFWAKDNIDEIDFGNGEVNLSIGVFLSSGMFMAALISFILDNTIPGNLEDRGIFTNATTNAGVTNEALVEENDGDSDPIYDLPFGMAFIRRHEFFSWIPISPTFRKSNLIAILRRKCSLVNRSQN